MCCNLPSNLSEFKKKSICDKIGCDYNKCDWKNDGWKGDTDAPTPSPTISGDCSAVSQVELYSARYRNL